MLAIFLALVPPILAALAKWAGAVSEGDVDASVLNRYFIFQVGAGGWWWGGGWAMRGSEGTQ